MEKQAETSEKPKPKAKKEVSGLRKITAELDSEVRKVETNKLRLAKLEKTIADGNDRIKALTSKLTKNLA